MEVWTMVPQILEAYGVPWVILGMEENFDYHGVSDQLVTSGSSPIRRSLIQEGHVYLIRDRYEEHSLSMLIPENSSCPDRGRMIAIGPYLTQDVDFILEQVEKRQELAAEEREDLRMRLSELPYVADNDAFCAVMIAALAGLMPDGERPAVEWVGNLFWSADLRARRVPEDDPEVMKQIQTRYEHEDALIQAVCEHRREDASQEVKTLFSSWPGGAVEGTQPRLRARAYRINTLFCRAAVQMKVHPAHIERISRAMEGRIEQSTRRRELSELLQEMVQKYCYLVEFHALNQYSRVVRDALAYIDINLEAALGLKDIAAALSVNPSYLSSAFHREMGKTLTDYVNEARIQRSLNWLVSTDATVAEIASRVGIADANYYAKIFRKCKGMSATEYRRMMRR